MTGTNRRLILEIESIKDNPESPLDAFDHHTEQHLRAALERCGWMLMQISEDLEE